MVVVDDEEEDIAGFMIGHNLVAYSYPLTHNGAYYFLPGYLKFPC